MQVKDYRELEVWQRGRAIAKGSYLLTRTFPTGELYGMTSQIRRAATSIPANIAEGCCRDGDNEFARFLQFSMGSASELEYYCLLAGDLGLLETEDVKRLTSAVTEVKRMLAALIRKVKHKN